MANFETSYVTNTFNTGEGPGDIKIGKDVTLASYGSMPIENFGKSMLQNMGWYEGRGVGRNVSNAMIDPIEFLPRHHRLGLGATPMPARTKIDKKTGKKIQIGPNQYEGGSQSRNFKSINEKLEMKKVMEVGSEVYIFEGKHKDLYGKIVEIKRENVFDTEGDISDDTMLFIELMLNDQIVSVPKKKVILTSEKERLEKRLKGSRDSPEPVKEKKSKKEEKKRKEKKKRKLRWVLPGILVRVISKKVMSGKLYMKKLKVQDVHDKYTFTVVTPDSQVLDSLREKDIETIIPKGNEPIMVLRGEHKGEVGRLYERDKKKDRCIIQLHDELEFVTCSQSDCCQVA